MDNNYPLIENLMNAYLNQDFDYICESETIEGALDYYIRNSSDNILTALLAEIADFKSQYTSNLDQAFEEAFNPEVIIPDVKEFLSLLSVKIRTVNI